jgi:uncharacterized protein (DUF779 family)
LDEVTDGMSAPVERIVATPSAREAIAEVTADGGPIMFFQSGGCCDGSLPICFRDGEFTIGNHDVRLGTVGGSAFYMDHRQFEAWKHTQLILDVGAGEPEGFSLAAGPDRHFITRSRVFSEGEMAVLESAGDG